ncbi:MAG: RloB family protein [Hydrogenophaga sp.]|uniref:RloB family protein n=1 Tax=Hydrogenophaga sp. TaxID=1904254 RepID=UPI00271C97B6|nr:RloB family protein [Hydrogenophaga sp.]MDO9568878.1 RloB family protein [Hydrogenophaga sp.]MDP3375022.1 RloB family protein [Hydrogenophaga sp.]
MGSDNLFHKRKARKAAELARGAATRAQSPRVLIVCEGEKTEPLYLNDLKADLRIRPAAVKIAPHDGSSPDRVVAHGHALYEEDARQGDSFDAVYFVFDRDKHPTYAAALQALNDCKAAGKPFHAVTSIPCFEYWLLLHFGFTDQPFDAAGKKSAADRLIAELRTKPGFKQYGKGQKGIYALLKDKLPTAIQGAALGLKNAAKTGEDNPTTRMHELVAALQALSET